MRPLAFILAAIVCVSYSTPLAAQALPGARAQYVLLVSIDGARPDGLCATGTRGLPTKESFLITPVPFTLPA